jgi:hypothetical protein
MGIKDLQRDWAKDEPPVGRIRLGHHGHHAPRRPEKLDTFRLTSSDAATGQIARCPVCGVRMGVGHLRRHPFWKRLVAALARRPR